ncbi:hypothetical protein [Amycolatopsis sp. NBC_01480]|uniref:hypothetical protein n=1 Tax=Amycolatopsis sp. NBC_01480 TaxID=2903562 RepID=UPI002E2D3A8C|nr:hypothetical protein [Amycolatopsis sp. NBC_01480]
MAKRTASVSDLVEQMAGLAEEIKTAAVNETRKYVAMGIEDHLIKATDRQTYSGMTPDESIVEALREFPTLREARLQAALKRFEANEDEVTDDFRAGLLMAIRLFADPEYDY